MLFTFFQGVAPRQLAFVFPPDWYDHVEDGTLALLVLLHGGNQDVTDFMTDVVRIFDLLQGHFHVVSGVPTPQKLVAVFPAGLSRDSVIAGQWRAGHIGGDCDPIGNDDVSFVFACVDLVDQMLLRELKRLKGLTADSVFAPRRRFLTGFSGGAALVAHVLARRPGFFRAAAMHSHLFGGYKHAFLNDPLLPALNLENNVPAQGDPGVSLFHLVGSVDPKVIPENGTTANSGTPLDAKEASDAYVGSTGVRPAADYYRLDLSIDDGVEAWGASVFAYLPAGGWVPFRDSTGRRQGSMRVFTPGTYADGTSAGVRQVVLRGVGHKWWYVSDEVNATKVFWDWFQLWT